MVQYIIIQIKLNLGFAKNLAINIIMRRNINKSNKSSSCNIVLETLQSIFESTLANNIFNTIFVNKNMQVSAVMEATQKILSNIVLPSTLGTGNLISQ